METHKILDRLELFTEELNNTGETYFDRKFYQNDTPFELDEAFTKSLNIDTCDPTFNAILTCTNTLARLQEKINEDSYGDPEEFKSVILDYSLMGAFYFFKALCLLEYRLKKWEKEKEQLDKQLVEHYNQKSPVQVDAELNTTQVVDDIEPTKDNEEFIIDVTKNPVQLQEVTSSKLGKFIDTLFGK